MYLVNIVDIDETRIPLKIRLRNEQQTTLKKWKQDQDHNNNNIF